MSRTPLFVALLFTSLLACASDDVGDTPAQLKGFPESTITITHTGGRDSFRVWIADTPARQQQGLMFVRRMAADRGMLFPQRAPRPMAMWMKNTYLPLDMVFIGEGGLITGIAANTKPLTLDTVESPGPITAVLELNAGEAARRGIRVGDKVE
jgi:uncharacterized membrane protein (UPF0127 family)